MVWLIRVGRYVYIRNNRTDPYWSVSLEHSFLSRRRVCATLLDHYQTTPCNEYPTAPSLHSTPDRHIITILIPSLTRIKPHSLYILQPLRYPSPRPSAVPFHLRITHCPRILSVRTGESISENLIDAALSQIQLSSYCPC